jgi:hypothetical protein
MSTLLSVDPGLRGCGCALWRDGQLVRAAYVRGSADQREAFVDVILNMAGNVEVFMTAAGSIDLLFDYAIASLIIERQRVYGGRAARGDASDLIDVAVVVGAIVGRLGVPSRIVLPQEWGCAEKSVNMERAKRDLSPEELARVELPGSRGRVNKKLAENVWDAVAIGLSELKRTKAR